LALKFLPDGVENPANLARIEDVATALGGVCVLSPEGRLIAVENTAAAKSVYGRRSLRETATLAVGNERRGLSRAILNAADETVVIPPLSRAVTTLNVASAAAVAGWYVKHGSGPQARGPHPERRRPSVLISGEDHVEVGSSLRSAAAFGFREVHLDDRANSWFNGEHHQMREARAAARRHKNPLRVRRATIELATRFEEVLVITAAGTAPRITREQLTHGRRQLVVIGLPTAEIPDLSAANIKTASLALEGSDSPPLRIVASIAMAEIARQVGQPAAQQRAPKTGGPKYSRDLKLAANDQILLVEAEELLDY